MMAKGLMHQHSRFIFIGDLQILSWSFLKINIAFLFLKPGRASLLRP